MSEAPGRAPAHQRAPGAGSLPRFVLLLVLFVGIAAATAGTIIDAIADQDGVRVGCGLAAGGDPGLSDLDVVVRIAEQQSAYDDCVDRFVPAQAWWWKPGALILLLVCAAVVYWILPAWKGRRGLVVPIEEVEGHAELRAVLAELVTVAGLRRQPRFVIAPAVSTTGAVVFGRLRHHTVRLNGGLLARRRRDPEGFRAVVLHELAHLRNRDVDITYATVALWRVLLGVVLPLDLAYILAVSLPETAGTYMQTREQSRVVHHLAMLAVTVVLVYLARADILRTREFHADLTARRWGADVRLWQAAAGRDPAGGHRSALGRLVARGAALWHTHPSWQQRLRSLADPAALLAPQRLPFFLTGATAAITATRMPALLALLGVGQQWRTWVIAATVAVLVTAVTGLLLRPGSADAAHAGGPASGLRAGWWLSVGLVVGEIAVGRAGSVWDLLPEQPAFLLLLALAAFGVTWWTAEYARMSAAPTGSRPRWPTLLGLGVSCFVLALWWGWWEADGTIYAGGMLSFFGDAAVGSHEQVLTGGQGYEGPLLELVPGLPVLLALTRRPDLLWAAGALWLLPLLAWLRRPTVVARLRPTIAAAGIGGLGAVAVTACVRAWSPPVDGREQPHLIAYTMWVMVAVLACMWLAAAATAATASPFPLLRGLVVAGTTGLAGLGALAVLVTVDGCVRPLAVLGSSCDPDPWAGEWIVELLAPTTLGLGLFLAVPVAAVAAVAGGSLRRLRARGAPAPAGQATGGGVTARPRWPAVVGVVGLCLAATATSTAVTVAHLRSPAPAATDSGGLSPALTDRPTSPAVRAAQVRAWLALGGNELVMQIAGSLLELSKPFGSDDADEARRALTDWAFIDAEIRPRCAAVTERVAHARRYFDHPEPGGQAAWTALLSRAEQMGVDCDLAVRQRDRLRYAAALRQLAAIVEDAPATVRAVVG
ncbi:M48 family metalloprotease [Micromonospora sp. NPDC048830]|uniref:M48 family metalloprotease n=1 Tax=Micromonospora sp. NPDC048830 TaxID=3364257 RepID=UPI0037155307